MTLRLLFISLTILLLSIAALVLTQGSTLLILILILASLLSLLAIYRLGALPIHTLSRGITMLQGQDFNSRLKLTGHDDTDRLVKLFNNMIAGLHQERRIIQETNRYLDLLIEASPLGIINFSHDEKVCQINPAAAKILNINPSEIIGVQLHHIPGRIGSSIASLKPGQSTILDLRAGGSNDNIISISCYNYFDRGFPRLTIFIEPMTEIIRSTERTAYERIIRMMAHEINNSMGAIQSAFDILADTAAVSNDPDLPPLLQSCAERTASLTSFIDSYARVARLPKPQKAPVNVLTLLTNAFPSLQAVAQNATLELDCPNASFIANIDYVQIEQVMVNIVKNAAESIAKTKRNDGRIIISIDPDNRSITVTDNGIGIAADIEPMLFTPFFSSKSGPSTSGIGLTLTAEILRAHSASFSLSTSPTDSLTRFSIILQ